MIEMVHVSKVYGARTQALFDITLKVEKGRFVYLTGPSGAGKTTLLRLLYAAERPTEGEVRVNGLDVVRLKPRQVPYLRRSLGVVFQGAKLLSRHTVLENVAFALEVLGDRGREVFQKTTQILHLVGLDSKVHCLPSQLSSGEQQRVAIARAIVNDPVLLLADEPTGNIDPGSAEEIMKLFEEINFHGTTVVLATHHNDGLPLTGSKERIVLERGRIVESSLPNPLAGD
jgi:cell division transport system ATP-binding protein